MRSMVENSRSRNFARYFTRPEFRGRHWATPGPLQAGCRGSRSRAAWCVTTHGAVPSVQVVDRSDDGGDRAVSPAKYRAVLHRVPLHIQFTHPPAQLGVLGLHRLRRRLAAGAGALRPASRPARLNPLRARGPDPVPERLGADPKSVAIPALVAPGLDSYSATASFLNCGGQFFIPNGTLSRSPRTSRVQGLRCPAPGRNARVLSGQPVRLRQGPRGARAGITSEN